MITKLNNSGVKVSYIEIDRIAPSPHQPRKNFDTDSLCGLSESIRNFGVIQPVTVRKTHGSYELVAGERRLRAARMAGLTKVPAIIQEMKEETAASVALIENIQRENLSFIEEAESYMTLMRRSGMTQEELAKKMGKSQSAIANKLRILKLTDKVKEAISSNNLTERHARALLKIDDDCLQLELIRIIVKNNYNVAQTEDIIDNILREKENPKQKPVRKQVVKDVKIFVNTIKQAIQMIQRSGVNALAEENEDENYIQYIIKIAK